MAQKYNIYIIKINKFEIEMEASKVCEQLKYVSQAGVTLSTEERMQLEYALSTLQSSMQFEHLYFWGKITGKSNQT